MTTAYSDRSVSLRIAGNYILEVTNVSSTTRLNGAINNAVTTLTVNDTSQFPSSGTIKIESEEITYTGTTSTSFTGCARGANGTTAAAHVDDVFIKGWSTMNYTEIMSLEASEEINMIKSMNCVLSGVTRSTDEAFIQNNALYRLFYGSTYIQGGKLKKVEFDNMGSVSLSGLGYAVEWRDLSVTKTDDDADFKREWRNTTLSNIVIDLIAYARSKGIRSIDTGVGFVILGGASTLFHDHRISWFRSDADTLLGVFDDLASEVNAQWVIENAIETATSSYKAGSKDEFVLGMSELGNFGPDYGDSVTTYTTGTNAYGVTKDENPNKQVNKVVVAGGGTGNSQVRSVNFHSTVNRSKVRYGESRLIDAIDSSVTSIQVYDENAYQGATVGVPLTIKIDNEEITYTGFTGSILTGCTRGANGTTAATHIINSDVLSKSRLYLENVTSFPSSGDVFVGMEKITYSAKTGTINGYLTISTRGVSNTEAYAHDGGVEVYDAQYTVQQVEVGSDIEKYELREMPVNDPRIIDVNQADRRAYNVRVNHDNPVHYKVQVISPSHTEKAGYEVKLTDTTLGLSATTTYVSKVVRIFGSKGFSNTFICSDSFATPSQAQSDILRRASETSDKKTRYMQRTPNILEWSWEGNVVGVGSLSGNEHKVARLKIYIPPSVLSIERMRLGYTLKPFKIEGSVDPSITSNAVNYDHDSGSAAAILNTWTDLTSGVAGANCAPNAVGKLVRVARVKNTGGGAADNYYFRIRDNAGTPNNYPDATGSGPFNLVDTESATVYLEHSNVDPTLRYTLQGYSANGTTSDWDASLQLVGVHNVLEDSTSWPSTDVLLYIDGVVQTSSFEGENGTLPSTEDSELTDGRLDKDWFVGSMKGLWHTIDVVPDGDAYVKFNLVMECTLAEDEAAENEGGLPIVVGGYA